jgi:hypothetical protein
VHRASAASAASLGIIRGDLWADSALTYLNLFWGNGKDPDEQSDALVNEGYKAAERALTFAPHESSAWLVLAGIELRPGWINQGPAAAALRMSYYTGGNQAELIPLRLHLAIHSDALKDADFQDLVRHDIQLIVSRRADLKDAIVTAYAEATPSAQQFIEDTLKNLDPELLGRLRAS